MSLANGDRLVHEVESDLACRIMLKVLTLSWPLRPEAGWPAAVGGMLPRVLEAGNSSRVQSCSGTRRARDPQTPPFVGWELQ